ncbi:hypothetical protein MCOR02_011227 [Pyricularia oryzae]|uniref:Peptidase M4 C-terminal domain-containing protein n=1 Tax=Pyricularia oryzae TaxID=318829 RepID=A0A4P7NAR8_PYROR|nr:hypothetical protein MCOR02_011227 [Pyricularia oryzae]KAI6272415.1 hypothetical protein MCOR26_007354 [Pyricularia oryzae]KAI6291264.1 hypothetical protein MCOR34_010233 [Pyricularia oryzae]KAI6320973.1 hypothetical protein MCOR29_005105 [Pyricularia oryzae]KAI6340491.1 hypothetical protein MCOR28_006589 [Pyricularia oryzae]
MCRSFSLTEIVITNVSGSASFNEETRMAARRALGQNRDPHICHPTPYEIRRRSNPSLPEPSGTIYPHPLVNPIKEAPLMTEIRAFYRLEFKFKGENLDIVWQEGTNICNKGQGRIMGDVLVDPGNSIEIVTHLIQHYISQAYAPLDPVGESGCLSEHFGDVMGVMAKMWQDRQTAREGDWGIGRRCFMPGNDEIVIRDVRTPGSAYNDPRLGKDPQPMHMRDYIHDTTPPGIIDHRKGNHVNTGIPNRAFAIVALAYGGYAWEKAGQIWWAAMTSRAVPAKCSLSKFALVTCSIAEQFYGPTDARTVRFAWQEVGVLSASLWEHMSIFTVLMREELEDEYVAEAALAAQQQTDEQTQQQVEQESEQSTSASSPANNDTGLTTTRPASPASWTTDDENATTAQGTPAPPTPELSPTYDVDDDEEQVMFTPPTTRMPSPAGRDPRLHPTPINPHGYSENVINGAIAAANFIMEKAVEVDLRRQHREACEREAAFMAACGLSPLAGPSYTFEQRSRGRSSTRGSNVVGRLTFVGTSSSGVQTSPVGESTSTASSTAKEQSTVSSTASVESTSINEPGALDMSAFTDDDTQDVVDRDLVIRNAGTAVGRRAQGGHGNCKTTF